MKWENDIKLSGTGAIVLTRKLIYADSNEYEYELLQLFRLSETSKWSVDASLANMAADNFDTKDYDGVVLVDSK